MGDFLGRWRLERDILHGDGTRGTFLGECLWQAEGTGAICCESGTLILPGRGGFAAERRFLWDAALNVRFADGRFFHTVPREGGAAEHWCDPDDYRVSYDFALWPEWRSHWTVRGPRKDYRMTSRYRRIAA